MSVDWQCPLAVSRRFSCGFLEVLVCWPCQGVAAAVHGDVSSVFLTRQGALSPLFASVGVCRYTQQKKTIEGLHDRFAF